MTAATRRELAKVLRRLRRKNRHRRLCVGGGNEFGSGFHRAADYVHRDIDAELAKLKPKRSKKP